MPVINTVLKHIRNMGVAKSVFGKSGSARLLGPPGTLGGDVPGRTSPRCHSLPFGQRADGYLS